MERGTGPEASGHPNFVDLLPIISRRVAVCRGAWSEQRFGQAGATMSVAMNAQPEDELVMMVHECHGPGHLPDGERPLAVGVVDVVGVFLEEDADPGFLGVFRSSVP